MALTKGAKYVAFLASFVGFIGIALYPIAISPMIDASEYKKIQKETRKNIKQDEIQPGNLYKTGRESKPRIMEFDMNKTWFKHEYRKNIENYMPVWSDPFSRKKSEAE